jgi:hypothetical protein
MVSTEQLTNYLTLLKIRQSAYRRNLYIAGGLFLFSIFTTLGMGLLTEWNVRSFYIMGAFNVLFIVNFLMAWARLEIVKGNIDMLINLSVESR